MTPTIKDPPEITGQTTRSNPVCLEVPVTIRSLPGEHGNDAGVAGPIREDGRTVIVFDSGAVLKVPNALPAGQTVILTNQHGRDVVCKVASGRNLPSIKGYIEVEFIEPVDDFWRVHQGSEPVSAPPVVFPPERSSQGHQAGSQTTTRGNGHETDSPSPGLTASGNAPSFEDIAGLVRMSPPAVVREKTREHARESVRDREKDKKADAADPLAALKITDKPSHRGVEAASSAPATTVAYHSTVTPNVALNVPAPVAAQVGSPAAAKAVNFPVQDAPATPAKPPSPSVDSDLRPMPASTHSVAASPSFSGNASPSFGSVAASTMTSASGAVAGESSSKMPMILGGAALMLFGFGAAFLFMHKGSTPDPQPVAAVSAPSSQPSSVGTVAPTYSPSPEVQQSPRQSIQPAPTPLSTPMVSSSREPELADVPKSQRPANTEQVKPEDRTPARNSSLANLGMNSPKAPKQNVGKLGDAAALPEPDVTTAAASTGASNGVMLSSVARGISQPAPPPTAVSRAVVASSATEAKLITSTRPVYPDMARQTKAQGTVVVSFTVDTKGNVTDAKAVSGPILLRESAVEAVRKWKYSPSLLDGRPTASQVSVGVNFRLQ